ncbi:HNH endonuclease [Elizabethkingia anophelis]|nr:HNH endonuclease [Elizabethkingia anophelis]
MIEFYFEDAPKHRDTYPQYATYNQYRPILREDFNKRCAYCRDLDQYKISNFSIDHYVPRNPKGCVSTIPDNQYDNLIYACSYCNRAKWNKWPTMDTSIENDGNIGFLKPTSNEYRNLFYRTRDGKIFPKPDTPLASYIWEELKLWFPIHSLMWRIEKLMELDDKINKRLESSPNDELEKIHYEITKAIVKICKDIFKHND